MLDPKGDKSSRLKNSSLSFEHLLYTLTAPLIPGTTGSTPKQQPVALPNCTLQNAGNHALMCLFAFQKLLEPGSSNVPTVKKFNAGMTNATPMPMPFMPMPMQLLMPAAMGVPRMNFNNLPPAMPSASTIQRPTSAYDLSSEFGQMLVESAGHRRSTGDGFLSVPGRPGEKGSKRFNSFPGPGINPGPEKGT